MSALGTQRSPEVECPAWATGVSAQAFSVKIGGSVEAGRKELGIPVTTWNEGGLSTVSETPDMICWFACVIALSLRSSTKPRKPRKRIAGKRARIARRVGKVRTSSSCLRLMKSKPSVLCLTETWADKGLPTMRIEDYKLTSRHD